MSSLAVLSRASPAIHLAAQQRGKDFHYLN